MSILSARTAFFLNLCLHNAGHRPFFVAGGNCRSLQQPDAGQLRRCPGRWRECNGNAQLACMTKAEMLSPDGRRYTLDNRANGFVP